MKVFAFNLKIGAMDEFSSTFANVGKKMDRLGRKAKRLGQSMSIGITAPLALFGREAINTQLQLEAMENKMAGSLGSFEMAAVEIKHLREEADRMGINFLDAADGFASFSASATRSGISLEDTRAIFTDFAETGTALKMSGETSRRVFKALEQMAGKGVVSMEELKLQLADSLPGAVALAAQSMDMTTQEFIKMTSQGKILANDFLPKFGRTVRKELGGSFDEASKGSAAALARYQNAMIDLKGTLATSGLMDALIAFTRALAKVANAFVGLSPQMQKFIVFALIITAALGPILFAFGQLLIIIPALAASWGAIAVAAPWIAIAAALGGAVWAFKKLSDMAGGFKNAMLVLGGVILDMVFTPLRWVWKLLGKITGLSFFKKMGNQSFGRAAAEHVVKNQQEGDAKIAQARASIQEQQELYKIQQAATKGDKAAIEILFKNAPPGMRTNIKSETNANITIDQGIAMEGNY